MKRVHLAGDTEYKKKYQEPACSTPIMVRPGRLVKFDLTVREEDVTCLLCKEIIQNRKLREWGARKRLGV